MVDASAGDGAGREAVEVELVDAAVAPHLLVGGRQAGGGDPLGRVGAPRRQSGRAGQPSDGVGGERAQGDLTREPGAVPAPGSAQLPAVRRLPKVGGV